ncbi:hypothetical protein [Parabacteroides johnsonii]|uniref:hypothetical protein n=1 Tax=Parabacteroides johnsonii TaxID=387661 RepID=UPI0011DD52BF|nr:hypothetical protein [Parabacteroides johnsonii]MBP3640271.1 hypothetical protein [Parabacteroides sp.]
MVTDKFHFGLGVAPTLYVQPQTVFDLSIMAKVGYRLSKHCELGLSYQYGCLNTLKHFNTTIINPFPTSVEKALLFVFLERERAFPRHSPEILTYLFRIAWESPGTGNSGLATESCLQMSVCAIRMSANCQIPDCHSTNSF